MAIRSRSAGCAIVIAVWGCLAGTAYGQCANWSGPTNLSNATGRFAVDASMAIDSAGKAHVVYQVFLDATGETYYTTNAGGTWSAPQNIGNLGGKGSVPLIVITPDNTLHAFYGKGTLYTRSKPVSGGSWSSPVQVSAWGGSFTSGVAVDSTGGIYFVYGHLFDNSAPARNGIYGTYKPLGGAWGPTELIYGNSQDSNWPSATHIAAKGTTFWLAMDLDDRCYYKKRPAGGPWPSGKGTTFHTTGGGLKFYFHPTSNEVAGIFGYDTGGGQTGSWYEIFVRYSYDDGATWGASQNISAYAVDLDRIPIACYNANGNLHVIWEGFCCDHKARPRYRVRTGGAWGDILTLDSYVGGFTTDGLKTYNNQMFLVRSATGSGLPGQYDVLYYSQPGPTQPRISISQPSFQRTMWIRDSLPNDAFTVGNGCAGTLNYSITDNAAWLSVTPTSGTAVFNVDPITIIYGGASQLNAGVHNAVITVTGNAMNSPQNVTVTVTVQTVRCDFDGDADVDLDDFAYLQKCYSGQAVPQTDPACSAAKLDADADVDADDFLVLRNCLSGQGIPAVRTCAG